MNRGRSFGFVLFLICLCGCSSDSGASSDVGKEGALHYGGMDILVAKSVADLPEATRVLMTRDSTGERKLFADGNAFKVPDGTRAKILEDGPMGGIRVRILSGAGANMEGWVSSDCLN